MAGEIASLIVKLGLDQRDFTTGIAQANKTTDSFSKGLLTKGNVASAAFVGLGAGLAVVTKGAMEAERAQGDFMAATGLSRDEAKGFVSDMDGLAGSSAFVGQSFDKIAAAGTEVARQFKLTGAEGAAMTEQFGEFAKVTKSDTVASINAMDDTLDAFHEPASKATDIMNELVASNQKFGTEVGPDVITMLGKMAPALQVMGANIDDGVGLLNLMENSGLDTSAALKGIVAASAKMPDGMNLKSFLDHLQDLKDQGIDPTSEAIKVFGTKAGTGLANSILKGSHGLDDYTVSAKEAGDAVSTASDNMLTMSDRVKALGDKMLAGAREIGNKFGPALTGAASAASLAAPLLKKMAPLGKALAKPLASALSAGLSKGMTLGANFATNMASKIVGPLTNALGTAMGGVASKLATNSALMGGMDKIGGMMGGRIGTALKGAAALGLAGLAVEMLPALMEQWDQIRIKLQDIGHATSETAGKSTEEILAAVANLRKVPDSFDPLKRGIFELSAALPFALGDAKNTWGRSLNDLETELRNRGVDVDAALADLNTNAAATVDATAHLSPDAIDRSTAATTDAIDNAGVDVEDAFDQYVQKFEDGSAQVEVAGMQLASFDPDLKAWQLGRDFDTASEDTQAGIERYIADQNAAVAAGTSDLGKTLEDLRAVVTDKLSAVQDAFDIGVDTKKKKNVSGAERLRQMAKDIDEITKNLHDSIKANDPVNTAYWESALGTATSKYSAAKQSINVDSAAITQDLNTMGVDASTVFTGLGKDAKKSKNKVNTAAEQVNFQPAATAVANAGDSMHDSFVAAGDSAGKVPPAIRSYIPFVQTAAQGLANAATNPMSNVPADLYDYGEHGGSQFVSGLKDGGSGLGSVAQHWANLLERKLGFSSPPPEGPLHNLPQWGPHMIEAWIGPMERHGMRRVPAAAQRLAHYLATLGKMDTGHHRSGDWHDTAAPLPTRAHHARHRWQDAHNPDLRDNDDDGASVVVNVTVQGNVYGTGGVKQLATDIENYMRRSKRGGGRLVGAF